MTFPSYSGYYPALALNPPSPPRKAPGRYMATNPGPQFGQGVRQNPQIVGDKLAIGRAPSHSPMSGQQSSFVPKLWGYEKRN